MSDKAPDHMIPYTPSETLMVSCPVCDEFVELRVRLDIQACPIPNKDGWWSVLTLLPDQVAYNQHECCARPAETLFTENMIVPFLPKISPHGDQR